MVFGGYNNNQNYLANSEIFINNVWNMAAPMPIPMQGLRGVTLGNEVFAFGRITLNSLIALYSRKEA